MGLFSGFKEAIAKRAVVKALEKHMSKVKAVIDWLNAEPGRKRGIAAALLAGAAALRALGHSDLAHGFEQFNDIVQNIVVPGMDLGGFVTAIWGLGHSLARKPEEPKA